jgi:hypothetical protein
MNLLVFLTYILNNIIVYYNYCFHFKAPRRHSSFKPKNNIQRNFNKNKLILKYKLFNNIGNWRSKIISISKTRKKIKSKKNRKEKGNRELIFGSKPHSKGLLFSRFFLKFFPLFQ